MFYLGGMTLGYLEPPAPKAVVQAVKPRIELAQREPVDDREREREQEWARAFLTPWHLFY